MHDYAVVCFQDYQAVEEVAQQEVIEGHRNAVVSLTYLTIAVLFCQDVQAGEEADNEAMVNVGVENHQVSVYMHRYNMTAL